MIEPEKNFKQKVNEFLCKYAQSDFTDEYGNTVKKPDGKVYKSGHVTGWDVFITFIFNPLLILFLFLGVVSFIGYAIGDVLKFFGVIIDVHWLIDPFLKGIIVVGSIVLIIAILVIIYKLLIKEVAKCPLAEIPPERKKCSSCTAPLPYENEEIEVSIKNEKYERRSLGRCELCKAPKIYDGEGYNVTVKGYFKPKVEEKKE